MDKKRVLIVEDDAFLIELTRHVLEKHDYTVDSVRNSDDLFARIEAFKPNLIILDNLLERGATGLEICQKIKATPHLSGIFILLTTGQINFEESEDKKSQPNGILLKPFEVEDLLNKVSELIG